uniref:P2X purinoreceptor 7 intracellular domain-containing protein n=1 Tax=Panagrolaimus superbus TaxID=310955 RepID=A0A914Z1L7_9BILA
MPPSVVTKNIVLGRDLSDRCPIDTTYCSCANCRPMKQPAEAFCCKEIGRSTTSWAINFNKFMASGCICQDNRIKSVVGNKIELDIFIDTVKGLSNPENEDVELMGRNYRFALYKKLTIMIHGYIGAKQRMPLPSCLVAFVRATYPEEDEEDYCGFLDAS